MRTLRWLIHLISVEELAFATHSSLKAFGTTKVLKKVTVITPERAVEIYK